MDVENHVLKNKVTALKDKVEWLCRQVHELQQEIADKEVKIVQLRTRARPNAASKEIRELHRISRAFRFHQVLQALVQS
jgi:phage shock protein A